MAKRNSTRRKARKPELINVEGHQLTPALNAGYERCLEARAAQNPDRNAGETLRLGLDDFLSPHLLPRDYTMLDAFDRLGPELAEAAVRVQRAGLQCEETAHG